MSFACPKANQNNVRSDEALLELLFSLRASNYAFVTPTPLTHQRVLGRPPHATARNLRDIFGWSRVFQKECLPALLFRMLCEEGLVIETPAGWKSLVRVSSLGKDLFVHSAFPTTAPDSVFFGPDTYRFAKAIRDYLQISGGSLRRVVDIGCGAGVGGMVVSKTVACDEVLIADINDKALDFSQINVLAAGLGNVVPVRSDLLKNIDGDFDLIISNPPYLNDPLGRAYRNGGGPLGSALSLDIVNCAKNRLAPGGSLLLYTGAPVLDGNDPFFEAVKEAFEGSNLTWSYEEVDPDVFGEELDTEAYYEADRIAAVVLTARKEELFDARHGSYSAKNQPF